MKSSTAAATALCWIAAICSSLVASRPDKPCNKQWLDTVDGTSTGLFGGVLSTSQLGLIAANIKGAQNQLGRPANLLVFGVGDDSVTWRDINCDGTTVFLDNNADWIQETKLKSSDLVIHQVQYTGSTRDSERFYSKPWVVDLPEVVRNKCWDAIYVDSPAGYDPPDFPGRMESSYTAIKLAEQCIASGQLSAAYIYVHNANRSAEHEVIQRLFVPHPMVRPIGTFAGIGYAMQIAGFVVSKQHLPPLQQHADFAARRFGLQRCYDWADVVWNATHSGYGPKQQLNTAQMAVIVSSVKSAQYYSGRSPNFLVFGVGQDSVGWSMANCEGRTVFLEDNDEWLHKIAVDYPHLEISKVSYKGDMRESGSFFAEPWMMDLPTRVRDTCWDTILVDAPVGYAPESGQPGRMESSYAAIKLAEHCITSGQVNSVSIFLHDVGRALEKEIIQQLFATHPWMESVGVLKGTAQKHLAGFVMTQHKYQQQQQQEQQQQQLATGAAVADSAVKLQISQNSGASVLVSQAKDVDNAQQQQHQWHAGPRTMANGWRFDAPAAASHIEDGHSLFYPGNYIMQLGFLLLGIMGGLILRRWGRFLTTACNLRKQPGAGPLYAPLRT